MILKGMTTFHEISILCCALKYLKRLREGMISKFNLRLSQICLYRDNRHNAISLLSSKILKQLMLSDSTNMDESRRGKNKETAFSDENN